MMEREALTIFREIQKCRHQALHTNDCGNCERCQYYHTQEQLDEAVDMAISALEKQEADKCCETCKHKDRLVPEWRCSECFRASNLEDYWEPYTEEEA